MPQTILHIDINSYFATLLQQENPYLRGKPVGVVKDLGRRCIIAASKEAKQCGVKTGSDAHDARSLAPDIVFIPAQFDMYLDATYRLKHIFSSISPDYSVYSLDEAFVDISNCYLLYNDPAKLALSIQHKIKQQLRSWVTCNIGIAHTKLLAKMASEVSPKGSIAVVINSKTSLLREAGPRLGGEPEGFSEDRNIHHIPQDILLASTPFVDVCGVGPRLEKKLAAFNVEYPYQIRFFRPKDLQGLVGKFWAKQLLRIAYGEDPHFLQITDINPHMKSVGRSITGYQLAREESTIKRVLYNLVEEVTYKVRKMDMAGRYVWVKLYGHEVAFRAHKTLKYYIRHANDMYQLIYTMYKQRCQERFPVIKFAVRLGHLKPMTQISESLLCEWNQNEKLYTAMDHISNKYGLFTVYSGLLHRHKKIYPEVTGFLGDKMYYGL